MSVPYSAIDSVRGGGGREFEPTGWERVDPTVQKGRERLAGARAEEDFQGVGLLDSGAKRNALKRSGFERPFQARQSRLGMAS